MANQTNGNASPRKILRQKVEEILNVSNGSNKEKKYRGCSGNR